MTIPKGQAGETAQADELVQVRKKVEDLEKQIRVLRMANAELERVSLRDSLTPLYNRRHFFTALNERISRISRYGATSIVVFMDIDNMKLINDQYGHVAGDFALIHMAQLLLSETRGTDIVARVGGDEFAMILDEIGKNDANWKIEELVEAIRMNPCRFEGQQLPLSASFGATIIMAEDRDEEVIRRADQAMYAVKKAHLAH